MCCGSGGGGWSSTGTAPVSGGWATTAAAPPDGPWIHTAMDGTVTEVETYAEAAALARPGPGRVGGGGITRKNA